MANNTTGSKSLAVNALWIASTCSYQTPSALCTTNASRAKTRPRLLSPRRMYGSLTLVEEAEDLACDMLSPRLLVIHDAG